MNNNKIALQGILISNFDNYKDNKNLNLELYQDKSCFLTLQTINRNRSFKTRINPVYFCESISLSMKNNKPLIWNILSTKNNYQYIIFSQEETLKIYDFLMSSFILYYLKLIFSAFHIFLHRLLGVYKLYFLAYE